MGTLYGSSSYARNDAFVFATNATKIPLEQSVQIIKCKRNISIMSVCLKTFVMLMYAYIYMFRSIRRSEKNNHKDVVKLDYFIFTIMAV